MFAWRRRGPARAVSGGRDMPSEAQPETTSVPETKMEVAAPGSCVQSVALFVGRNA